MTGAEFHTRFEAAFSPGAAAAGLVRSRGRTPRWTHAVAGHALTIGFRLNQKNTASDPGQFMPDIIWTAPRADPRDPGDVAWPQYARPSELEAVQALQKRIIDRYIDECCLHAERARSDSYVAFLADACDAPIRPNHQRWLPYWHIDDAADWGRLFGRSMDGWVRRFEENPETLDAWCWRVLWSK